MQSIPPTNLRTTAIPAQWHRPNLPPGNLQIPGYGPMPGYEPIDTPLPPSLVAGTAPMISSGNNERLRERGCTTAAFEGAAGSRQSPTPAVSSILARAPSRGLWSSGNVRSPIQAPSPSRRPVSLQSGDIAMTPLRTTTSIPMQALSDSEKDRINKRRREQRAHERPFFKEMVNAHTEQRQPSFPIPTDAQGKVIGLKTKWHNSVRSIAKNILRWDIREYKQHPTEWNWVITSLIRELDNWYTYEPYPLCRKYVSRYLSRAIADDRSEWKKHYFATGLQHEDMLDVAFESWQPWWVSEEGMEKSEQMRELRSLGKDKRLESGPSSSGGARRSDILDSPSLRCPSHKVSVECSTW
jgi:hypothetical protein